MLAGDPPSMIERSHLPEHVRATAARRQLTLMEAAERSRDEATTMLEDYKARLVDARDSRGPAAGVSAVASATRVVSVVSQLAYFVLVSDFAFRT